MDFNSLKDQVSNLTLYDLKAYARKAQNAVMNYTELESKVREATNNEPWGASTTLMNEIAQGTHSYQGLGEIMPMLYKRFTEKTAEEWRQIYKALQLLEFLIKNGSERVVDDARGHVSLLKMLRRFEFIDQNGKDQGLNVRNRAKELAELLGDVEKIRSERKKAKGNRSKYGGVEGGSGFSGGISSGSSRYGGFGSEDAGYGGYTGGVYGDGGGFGGQTESNFGGSSNRRQQYEEYDEGDDAASAPRRTAAMSSRKPAPPPKAKEPEVNFLEFGDDDDVPAPVKPALASPPPATTAASANDDFDDFVSADAPAVSAPAVPAASLLQSVAVGSTTTFAAPQPQSGLGASGFGNIMANFSPPPSSATSAIVSSPPRSTSAFQPIATMGAIQPSAIASSQPAKPTGYQPAAPNYFTSVRAGASASPTPSTASMTPMQSVTSTTTTSPLTGIGAQKPAGSAKPAGGDAFASLWGTASASAGVKKPAAPGPNLSSMAKEKASASIWGAPAKPMSASSAPQQRQSQATKSSPGGGLDDLLG